MPCNGYSDTLHALILWSPPPVDLQAAQIPPLSSGTSMPASLQSWILAKESLSTRW